MTSRSTITRAVHAALLLAAFAFAQQAPMAVYPGPGFDTAARRAMALPPAYAAGFEAPGQYRLPPLSGGERAGAPNRLLPQTGIRRNAPIEALERATVVTLPDGRRVWRVNIVSPGAAGMRLHFRRFEAGAGQLWAYAPPGDGRALESEGPFTGRGPFDDGDFWTGTLTGESVTIEFLGETPDSGKPPPFEIDSIVHIWEKSTGLADSTNAAAAPCHLDVTCYPNYRDISKAVVQFNFAGDDGGYFACSGSMINTTNSSFTPYLLTAHHCIGSEAEARSMDARFFYQTSACNGTPPSRTSAPGVTGASYLAGTPFSQGDYALVLLNGPVPAGTWFLGWNAAGPGIGDPTVGIHHPAGSYKRISFGPRTNDETVYIGDEILPRILYYQVSVNRGKIEGGSSGSPLLNEAGQILGTASAAPIIPPGESVCDIDPEEVTYSRFSTIYAGIRDYLEGAPSPSITVTPSSMTFTAVNGEYSGPSQQAITIRTQSAAALQYSLTASAPWIRLSRSGGSVSASSPATVLVSLDLSYFSATTSAAGTVSVSSGTLKPLTVSVRADVAITRSRVVAAVTPNPVYEQTADSEGYTWHYTLRLTETAGVATRVTGFKYEGTALPGSIASWFGSDVLPARGTLSSSLRNRDLPVPSTRLLEVTGADLATGLPWSVQVTVTFMARPTKAVLLLDSYPSLVRQDPNSTACPWYQRLVVQESGGLGVTLSRFVAGGHDLSNQIPTYWGGTGLPPNGSLLGGICWSSIQVPTVFEVEVGGADSGGSTVSAKVTARFSGPAAFPTTMAASTTSLVLEAPAGSSSPVTRTLSLSIGSPTASWTGRLVFPEAPNAWLTVWPLSGTGSTTLNVSALPAGLPAGTRDATLLLESADAVPQLLSIPISLLITQAGPSITSVSNSASFLPGISSGTWFSVFGTNLAQSTRLWQASDFAGSRLPTELDGVSVLVRGRPAPVYYISPTQINALSPDDPTLGPVSIQVLSAQGSSAPLTVTKRVFSPAWFMFEPEGQKYVAGVHLDGGYLAKPGLFAGQNLRAAGPGEVVMLFGTGFGPVSPPAPTDQIVAQPGRLTSPVLVRIGGVPADLQWAGLVSPGLYQFNVVVPNLPDGDWAVVADIGGITTQPGAFLTVQR